MLRERYIDVPKETLEKVRGLNISLSEESALISFMERDDVEGYVAFALKNSTTHASIMREFKLYSNFVYYDFIPASPSMKDIEELRASYDNGVVYADAFVEEFLQTLESLGVLNNTLIIITSDHGEELYNHEQYDHSSFYDSVIHVPWVFIHPKVDGRFDYEGIAQSIDINPTLLSILNVSLPPSFQGKALLGSLHSTEANKYAFGYSSGGSYVRSSDWKYIQERNGEEELYYLSKDPSEMNNLITRLTSEEKKTASTLARELFTWKVLQS